MSKLLHKANIAASIFMRALDTMREHVELDQTFPKDHRKAIVAIASIVASRPPPECLAFMIGLESKDRARVMAKALRAAADVLESMSADPEFGSANITEEDIDNAEKEMG